MFTRATCENGTWNWKLLSFINHLPYWCAHGSETCEIRTIPLGFYIGSVQFSCSVMSNSATPWTAACQDSLSITNSRSLLKLMPIESVMPSNQSSSIVLLLPAFNLFQHKGFSSESHLRIRWSKYCSFSFNISPSNEYSGLISFRIDWLDLLVAQGTLKSLFQHHSSKPSILWHSAFLIVQLSHPWKTHSFH